MPTNQHISFRYKFELTARAFNTMWRGLLRHGVYLGLEPTVISGGNISVSKGVVIVDDGTVATKISFPDPFSITGLSAANPYAVIRYQYADTLSVEAFPAGVSENNLIDVYEFGTGFMTRSAYNALSSAQKTALGRRVGGDVILAKCNFTGSAISSFNTSVRDFGNMLVPNLVYQANTDTYEFRQPFSSTPDANLAAQELIIKTLRFDDDGLVYFPNGTQAKLLTTDEKAAIVNAGRAASLVLTANSQATASGNCVVTIKDNRAGATQPSTSINAPVSIGTNCLTAFQSLASSINSASTVVSAAAGGTGVAATLTLTMRSFGSLGASDVTASLSMVSGFTNVAPTDQTALTGGIDVPSATNPLVSEQGLSVVSGDLGSHVTQDVPTDGTEGPHGLKQGHFANNTGINADRLDSKHWSAALSGGDTTGTTGGIKEYVDFRDNLFIKRITDLRVWRYGVHRNAANFLDSQNRPDLTKLPNGTNFAAVEPKAGNGPEDGAWPLISTAETQVGWLVRFQTMLFNLTGSAKQVSFTLNTVNKVSVYLNKIQIGSYSLGDTVITCSNITIPAGVSILEVMHYWDGAGTPTLSYSGTPLADALESVGCFLGVLSPYDSNETAIIPGQGFALGSNTLTTPVSSDPPSKWPTAFSVHPVYEGGYPANYGTLINFGGGTGNARSQMFFSWPGTDANTTYVAIWIRGCRDQAGVGGAPDQFSSWTKLTRDRTAADGTILSDLVHSANYANEAVSATTADSSPIFTTQESNQIRAYWGNIDENNFLRFSVDNFHGMTGGSIGNGAAIKTSTLGLDYTFIRGNNPSGDRNRVEFFDAAASATYARTFAYSYETNNSDFAEWIKCVEPLERGSVVCISDAVDDQYEAAVMPYDTSVAGIISTEPGILGNTKAVERLVVTKETVTETVTNEDGTTETVEREVTHKKTEPIPDTENYLPMGFSGRVPLLVTTQVLVNGKTTRRPIKRGALLVTSAIKGHAMAASIDDFADGHIPEGTVVAKALQPFDPQEGESTEGKIYALISLS